MGFSVRAAKEPGDPLWMEHAPELVGDDETAVGPSPASSQSFRRLPGVVRAQRADGCGVEWDGPHPARVFGALRRI